MEHQVNSQDEIEVDSEEILSTKSAFGEERPESSESVELSDEAEVTKRSQKIPFKLKKLENGNILTVHHTVREQDKLIRIRMAAFCFNQRGSQFVTVDKRGNIFVFDLTIKKYWRLWQQVPKVSTIRQSVTRPNEYLIGTKLGHVLLIDITQQNVLKAATISTDRIAQISFPGQPLQPSHLALVHAGPEAILLNLDTFAATHRLDFDEVRYSLKYACFVPHSEQIFTCFTNDTLHVWSGVTLNTLRIAYPIKARDRKVKLVPEECIPEISLTSKLNADDEFMLLCQDQDFSNGLIVSFAFPPDGSLICLSTLDRYLLLLSAYTYEIQYCLRLKDFIISACEFLPMPKETLVLGITTVGQAVLIDCQRTEFKLVVHLAHACQLSVATDGRLLAVLLDSGEVFIWSTCSLYNLLKSQEQCFEMLKSAFKQQKPLSLACAGNSRFDDDLMKLLKHDRLMAILVEFGCYPTKYRGVIWSSLLRLPCNSPAFQDLVKMGIPYAIKERASKLKFKQEANRRMVIKIWSCLAHWCKVFAYCDFLPGLIFPFLQVYPKNALIVFELFATLLLNHFQLWFEFHPLEPANYLGMCANVLQHFDKELYCFYASYEILPKHYAWSLLSNAFSEVFDSEQWLCLWDNIISCPIDFPVFCAVAYNIQNREILLRLPNADAIEHFFHEQNPVDVYKIIKKACYLMDKCPDIVHPRRYMREFVPIPKGVYSKFLNYPKEWVKQHEQVIEALKQEQHSMDVRIRELELEEHKMMERLESGLKEEEHQKIMKEMEAVYQNTLKREEERVATQRKMLLLYQKEIRNRKGEILATLQESERRKRALEMEKQLAALTINIERERNRNDSHLMVAEDELRNREMELVAQKYSEVSQTPTLTLKYRDEINNLCKERTLLNKNLNELAKLSTEPRSSLDVIESNFNAIEKEFLRLTGKS